MNFDAYVQVSKEDWYSSLCEKAQTDFFGNSYIEVDGMKIRIVSTSAELESGEARILT